MVPGVDTPSIGRDPETRGPLVSLLTQWYTGAEQGTEGDRVDLPNDAAAIADLVLLFLLYVQETEAEHGEGSLDAIVSMATMFVQYARDTEARHGGDFLEFLQRQALEAFGGDEEDEDPAS